MQSPLLSFCQIDVNAFTPQRICSFHVNLPSYLSSSIQANSECIVFEWAPISFSWWQLIMPSLNVIVEFVLSTCPKVAARPSEVLLLTRSCEKGSLRSLSLWWVNWIFEWVLVKMLSDAVNMMWFNSGRSVIDMWLVSDAFTVVKTLIVMPQLHETCFPARHNCQFFPHWAGE